MSKLVVLLSFWKPIQPKVKVCLLQCKIQTTFSMDLVYKLCVWSESFGILIKIQRNNLRFDVAHRLKISQTVEAIKMCICTSEVPTHLTYWNFKSNFYVEECLDNKAPKRGWFELISQRLPIISFGKFFPMFCNLCKKRFVRSLPKVIPH